MEEAIEIKDNHTYDVIDKTPPWLMRWGIITVFVTIAGLLGIAAVVPYYETVSIPVTIGSANYVVAPLSGKVTANRLINREQVRAGDTLLITAQGSIIAPATGYIAYLNNAAFRINDMQKGDTLLKIMPKLGAHAIAMGFLKQSVPTIASAKLVLNEDINTISPDSIHIAALTDAPEGRVVSVMLNSIALKKIYGGMKGELRVSGKGESILRWIFKQS